MLRSVLLFYHSVSHTRFHQLMHRARLLLKRRFLARFGSGAYASKVALPLDFGEAKPVASPPLPVFANREHLVRRTKNGDLEVGFLNDWRSLGADVEWHPPEMKTGTRLWLLNLHYMEFLESLDDDQWPRIIRDWIEKNVPYKPGYWLDDWNSYSLSIRIVVWMQQTARKVLIFLRLTWSCFIVP